MKTMICQTGTLSFDGLTFKRGETFETSDEMAEHLLKHHLATEFTTVQEVPEYLEPEPGRNSGEEAPDTAAMVDLETTNFKEVLELIETTDNKETLESFLEAEQEGKNRKTVIQALNAKLEA